MKKDKEWAQKEVDRYLSYEGVNEARSALVFAKGVIDQLDEPEVLSQEFIDENKFKVNALDVYGNAVSDVVNDVIMVDDLQDLIVPTLSKTETVEITEEPETVADVVATFWKSYERLKEVMSMEVEEPEE